MVRSRPAHAPSFSGVPRVLLTLNGEGEESGDIWVKYYLNGKMQYEHSKIVLGPFDPSKLK